MNPEQLEALTAWMQKVHDVSNEQGVRLSGTVLVEVEAGDEAEESSYVATVYVTNGHMTLDVR